MSLSDPQVLSLLRGHFVCGWKNIEGEAYAGKSGDHMPSNPAVRTTNGAGPHNTQLFILASDGTVLHCLPGYWDPRDLAREIGLASQLNAVWRNGALTREQKDARFRELQLAHLATHPQDMVDRSVMQGFDKKFEQRRRGATSDCILREGSRMPALRPSRPRQQDEFKTTDQILHERMAARPFVKYADFDVARFSDYGRPKYDKKMDECGGDEAPKAGMTGPRSGK
ncbi:MAG TPA: hypothetical protein VHF22_15810 [Planctomycetota bacterium]|nr:hypothetical protein [Planctomycetota bacterium]